MTKAIPVLFAFFVMGFCDIVGISSDYAAKAFGWSSTMASLIPSVVFVWFFLLVVLRTYYHALCRQHPWRRRPRTLLHGIPCAGGHHPAGYLTYCAYGVKVKVKR